MLLQRVGIALQVFVDAGYRHVGRCLVAVGRRRHVIETHGVFVFRLLHERTPSEAAPEVVELHGAELVITRPEVCVGRVEQDGVFADGTLIVGRYLLEELQRFVEFPLLEVVERCLVHLLPVVAFQQFVITAAACCQKQDCGTDRYFQDRFCHGCDGLQARTVQMRTKLRNFNEMQKSLLHFLLLSVIMAKFVRSLRRFAERFDI